MPAALPSIEGWDNFYVIVGSSAAGLTGLTFVVIALASDAHVVRLSALRTFITPVVMHFGSTLWIAALLSIPGQTAITLSACITVSGAVLSAYGGSTTYRMYRGRREYQPVLEDWLWNAVLPSLCYLALLVAGVWALRQPAPALYIVGVVALTLLFIGIHNAWDLAVWITVERPAIQAKQNDSPTSGAGSKPPQTPPGPAPERAADR
jgi:hypothetical protein